MRTPSVYHAANMPTVKTYAYGAWIPARPMSYPGFNLMRRLRIAFLVFIGEYDALEWDRGYVGDYKEYSPVTPPPSEKPPKGFQR